MPQKQHRCLQWSPFVVFYAECLLVLQYIYGFDLNASELPDNIPESGHRLDEIGIAKYDYPVIHLGVKVNASFLA
jgi:hypothetical protein